METCSGTVDDSEEGEGRERESATSRRLTGGDVAAETSGPKRRSTNLHPIREAGRRGSDPRGQIGRRAAAPAGGSDSLTASPGLLCPCGERLQEGWKNVGVRGVGLGVAGLCLMIASPACSGGTGSVFTPHPARTEASEGGVDDIDLSVERVGTCARLLRPCRRDHE